jgi:hypothetical protein
MVEAEAYVSRADTPAFRTAGGLLTGLRSWNERQPALEAEQESWASDALLADLDVPREDLWEAAREFAALDFEAMPKPSCDSRLEVTRQMTFDDTKNTPLLPLLYSASGTGTLHIEGQADVGAEFSFEQHQDATLRLVCTLPFEVGWRNMTGADYGGESSVRRFVGLTKEGGRLEVPKLALDSHGTRNGAGFAEFLAYEATLTPLDEAGQPRDGQPHFVRVPLANFWFSPEIMDAHTFSNGFQVKGQQVPMCVDGRELTLCYRRNASDTMKVMKERRIAGVLSDVFLPITSWLGHHDLEEMLPVLCSLLTFTHDARVNWLGYDICDAGGRVLRRFCIRTATSGYKGDVAGGSWSPIPWIPSLAPFVEAAYTRYQQLWDDWDIYALITLFTELRGHEHGYLEVTGLHFCSCIEILNTSYKNRVGKREFRQALREICAAVGFAVAEKDLKRFTNNRNTLVHEGLFHVPDASVDPKTLRPCDRWDWYGTKAEERDREFHFMEDFVGTLIFCALGGSKKLSGW